MADQKKLTSRLKACKSQVLHWYLQNLESKARNPWAIERKTQALTGGGEKKSYNKISKFEISIHPKSVLKQGLQPYIQIAEGIN